MEDQDARALNGQFFDTKWPPYRAIKAKAHDTCRRFNQLDDLDPTRDDLLVGLFQEFGEGSHIRGPLQVNVGKHTRIGRNFFANFSLTILDDVAVTIGDDVQVGPNVQFLAGTHPLLFEERTQWQYADGHIGGVEYGDPIVIGNRVWIGAGSIILPGVTIGDGAVVGAGSLVNRDVPAGWLALGSPCRPVREIGEEDSVKGNPRG